MSLSDKLTIDRRRLKQIVRELKKWRAPATVLLSLYIPPGRPISDVMSMLRQEFSITDNIKLKQTREAVQRALKSAMDRLSMLSKVPPNGLVIFCGEDMQSKDFICLMFSPPEPVPIYFYRTDKVFHTEFLEDMVEENEVYGLIIVERDQATLGLLKGNRLVVLEELSDYIPGKHQRGGQSQRRYSRIIEQMVDNFYKRVGEHANKAFLPYLEKGVLKGILVGGPAYSKQDFLEGKYLDYRLQQKILRPLVDVSYQGWAGLSEMVQKAGDTIKGQRYMETARAVEEFKLHLAKDDGLAIYGEREVKEALKMGAAKFIIVDEERGDIDELEDLAKKTGAKVYLISDTLPEGEWLRKTFQGLVGVLRYRIS